MPRGTRKNDIPAGQVEADGFDPQLTRQVKQPRPRASPKKADSPEDDDSAPTVARTRRKRLAVDDSANSLTGAVELQHSSKGPANATKRARLETLPRLVQNPVNFAAPLDFLSPCPWKLPTQNNAISNFDPALVARDALETNVIMHPRLPMLITAFLQYKRKFGSKIERALYQDMSQPDLVARLVKNRPLHFVQTHDWTALRDCRCTQGGVFDSEKEWLRVGTADEHLNKFIKLEDYLSYDEMMLSSLIGTSGPTFFVNTGTRKNCAQLDPTVPHQGRGIIVGLVGARFAKPGQMEHALMLPPEVLSKSRQQDAGVTKMFQAFFSEKSAGGKSKVSMYKSRMRIPIETLLLEADDPAAQAGKTAYVHLVGLGLGVWAVSTFQRQWYVEEVTDCLTRLHLKHVSTLEIAWVAAPAKTAEACKAAGAAVGINVLFNKRAPSARLDTDELLVRSWAWDSNSLPGNEYWSGILDDTDDPAAACSSTIAELQNPFVNPFAYRIKVLQDRRRVS